MSWSNGWYFTKSEDKELQEFLEAQNLDEKQIVSIRTFHRSQITSSLNLWVGALSGLTLISGIFLGYGFSTWLGLYEKISKCVLF